MSKPWEELRPPISICPVCRKRFRLEFDPEELDIIPYCFTCDRDGEKTALKKACVTCLGTGNMPPPISRQSRLESMRL